MNVVATEASYQMLDVLLFCVRERAFKRHSIKITVLNFLVKKVRQLSFPGCRFFVNTRKTKLNLVLVLESYGLNELRSVRKLVYMNGIKIRKQTKLTSNSIKAKGHFLGDGLQKRITVAYLRLPVSTR